MKMHCLETRCCSLSQIREGAFRKSYEWGEVRGATEAMHVRQILIQPLRKQLTRRLTAINLAVLE